MGPIIGGSISLMARETASLAPFHWFRPTEGSLDSQPILSRQPTGVCSAAGSCFPLRKETSSCETEWCTGEEGEGTLGREKKTENRASLLAQWVKSLPAMQETWVQFLGQEDTLGKGMTTHSSILAWRIPWTEEPGSLQSMGSQESDTGK